MVFILGLGASLRLVALELHLVAGCRRAIAHVSLLLALEASWRIAELALFVLKVVLLLVVRSRAGGLVQERYLSRLGARLAALLGREQVLSPGEQVIHLGLMPLSKWHRIWRIPLGALP